MQYTFPVPELLNDKQVEIKKDSISERVESYLSSYDDKTVIAYKSDMQTFFNFLKMGVTEITEEDILSYLDHLNHSNFTNTTINRKIASLTKVLDIYYKMGIISSNPVRSLSATTRVYKSVDKRAKLNISLRDVEEVIRRARPRTGLIIKFLANTGLRISELINITKSDLEPFDNQFMKIKINGKGGKIRYIFVTVCCILK